jgi:hypothetical protein
MDASTIQCRFRVSAFETFVVERWFVVDVSKPVRSTAPEKSSTLMGRETHKFGHG